MRPRCCKCGRRVESWDFYMEAETGVICSSCLVTEKLPQQEFESLFRSDARRIGPGKRLALRAMEELGLRDLEQEPFFLRNGSADGAEPEADKRSSTITDAGGRHDVWKAV